MKSIFVHTRRVNTRALSPKSEKITSGSGRYIASIENDAATFGRAVRGHWGVENKLHWVLDIGFREDESRIRKDHAPANFAMVRHIALNLLKNEKTLKAGADTKRQKAGWDNEYMEKVLSSLK